MIYLFSGPTLPYLLYHRLYVDKVPNVSGLPTHHMIQSELGCGYAAARRLNSLKAALVGASDLEVQGQVVALDSKIFHFLMLIGKCVDQRPELRCDFLRVPGLVVDVQRRCVKRLHGLEIV